MGCDIHIHIEVKLGERWEHWGSPHISRNYKLFAKIANVRNDYEIEPLSETRAFPLGLSALTQACYVFDEKDGLHNQGWLDKQQVAELAEWWEKEHRPDGMSFEQDCVHTYLLGHGLNELHRWPDDHDLTKAGITDVRFIFWFDN